VKLLIFVVAMVSFPLSSYYLTVDNVFGGLSPPCHVAMSILLRPNSDRQSSSRSSPSLS
jgi:hypothetical protein